MRSFFRWLDRIYPLTATGTILFFVSLLLFGVWYGTKSFYPLAFSLVSFWSIFWLITIGVIQRLRSAKIPPTIETGRPVFARLNDQNVSVQLGARRSAFLFYRYHYRLKGKLKAGREAYFSVYSEGSSKEGISIQVPLYLPFCGMANFEGSLLLRDVFGLTRLLLSNIEPIQIVILPPFFPEKAPLKFDPSSAQESSRRIQTSEDEKYYMREYIPGDRLKDINWKTSFRIDELITRISPKSLEESRLVYIDIRPFHFSNNDGPVAILHLNYLKSWALSFLRSVMLKYPNYHFSVSIGAENHLIENEQDLDMLTRRLSVIEYQAEIEMPVDTIAERFVFTTMFDRGLSSYLRTHVSSVQLFRTVKGKGRSVPLIPSADLSVLPGLWIFRNQKVDSSEKQSIGPTHGRLVEEKLSLEWF